MLYEVITFPDDGQHAEYNTVDATLWYFQAVASYLHASGDEATVRALYPVLGDRNNFV